jgi:SAM-dependent methyltransferase
LDTEKAEGPKGRLAGSRKRRKRWERRYLQKQDADFVWYLDKPPDELAKLVEGNGLPPGAALDLGCGPGVATAYMARFFSPTIGLDIAHAAVSRARELAKSNNVSPSFVVAEAPLLPFRAGTFSLIFDRGCLQAIGREAWPTYFREVERLLRPGGALQLYCSKPLKQFPPMSSYRGLRARARWLLGRRGPQFMSHGLLKGLAGPGMEVLAMDDFPFRPTSGPVRVMTHAIFKKAEKS